ncbi:Hint domain-containing protein [Aliiroseovarius sp. YM-037]|uniref:Hint domain-containing protein n=1 Tax=Aliiroseovarius sp. YM-037 TaxID=3341728 RepID=UPI003A808785
MAVRHDFDDAADQLAVLENIKNVLRADDAGKAPPIAKVKPNPVPTTDVNQWTIDGIAGQTRVSTSFGDVPSELLRKNDMVRSISGDFKRIVWIDRIRLDEGFMSRHPEAYPIHIRANAFGKGIPARDIEVSPCHRLRVDRFTNGSVVAESLLHRPGVTRAPHPHVTYTQFHCDGDTMVKVENLWAESRKR